MTTFEYWLHLAEEKHHVEVLRHEGKITVDEKRVRLNYIRAERNLSFEQITEQENRQIAIYTRELWRAYLTSRGQ